MARGGSRSTSRTRLFDSAYDGQIAKATASAAGTHRRRSCSSEIRAVASGRARAAKIALTTTSSAPSS